MLAAGWLPFKTSNFDTDQGIAVFDHEVVNQDIYVTHIDTDGSLPVNYYIELEEVTMSKGEQAVVNFSAALLHGE